LVLTSFRPDDPEFASSFITHDELVLIASPRHAFAGRGRAQFKDLSEEPLLMMDVSQPSPWHKPVVEGFSRFKVPFRLQVENAPIESVKKMVAIGLGAGFVPLLGVREERARRASRDRPRGLSRRTFRVVGTPLGDGVPMHLLRRPWCLATRCREENLTGMRSKVVLVKRGA
jgi:DNA-binding transcriptional LysR family regulator